MKKQLKQAIINYLFENENQFQLLNATTEYFRSYIYDSKGSYLIGGEDVSEFISAAEKLIKE